MKLYAGVSANTMEILKGFAEKFQQVSVDEAYLLPGSEIRNYEEAALYALRIKDEIQMDSEKHIDPFSSSNPFCFLITQ